MSELYIYLKDNYENKKCFSFDDFENKILNEILPNTDNDLYEILQSFLSSKDVKSRPQKIKSYNHLFKICCLSYEIKSIKRNVYSIIDGLEGCS